MIKRFRLRAKFLVYLVLLHVPFALLAVWVLEKHRFFLIAVEVLFLISFIAGLRMVRSLFGPLDLIRSGAQFIQENDFGSRFREVGQPEMDQLVGIYNRMIDHLREERVKLEEHHFFLEKILKASPLGVITLNFDGRIALVSPGAVRMLQLSSAELIGKTLGQVEGSFARSIDELAPGESKILPLWGSRRVKCHRSEFLDRGFARVFYLLEELTEELRRSEKAAYETLIRMMSHEVNNTAGAAGSLLQSCLLYKDQIREEDRGDFTQALEVIASRTSELSRFMSGFSDVVRIPPPKPGPCNLVDVLEGIAALFRSESKRRRIEWKWDIDTHPVPPVMVDRGQMEQVLVNIVKNAMEAIGEDGALTVRLGREGDRTKLVIEDTGGGLTSAVRSNLFVPFFSTKKNGQGIGLTMVQEILTQHRLEFSLDGGPGQPTQFTIMF